MISLIRLFPCTWCILGLLLTKTAVANNNPSNIVPSVSLPASDGAPMSISSVSRRRIGTSDDEITCNIMRMMLRAVGMSDGSIEHGITFEKRTHESSNIANWFANVVQASRNTVRTSIISNYDNIIDYYKSLGRWLLSLLGMSETQTELKEEKIYDSEMCPLLKERLRYDFNRYWWRLLGMPMEEIEGNIELSKENEEKDAKAMRQIGRSLGMSDWENERHIVLERNKSDFVDITGIRTMVLGYGLVTLLTMCAINFKLWAFLNIPVNKQRYDDAVVSCAVLEPWQRELKIRVASLSLEPMTGEEIAQRLRGNMNDVVTRYIACVHFLVQCQQHLQNGLEYAIQRERELAAYTSCESLAAIDYFRVYVDQLPTMFYEKNVQSMEKQALDAAYQGLQKLRQEAKNSTFEGSEAVMSNFLGGMDDGESFGLRKWLSTHGNAFKICTDLECILNALKKADGCKESIGKLATMIRPMAKTALDRLRNDIPSSYQQRNTAHPFLPFFHRLEAALRSMSTFDPDEEDLICIDDSDAEDEVAVDDFKSFATGVAALLELDTKTEHVEADLGSLNEEPITIRSNREAEIIGITDQPAQHKHIQAYDEDISCRESDVERVIDIEDTESVIEIVEAMLVDGAADERDRDWICSSCSARNRGAYVPYQPCGAELPFQIRSAEAVVTGV